MAGSRRDGMTVTRRPRRVQPALAYLFNNLRTVENTSKIDVLEASAFQFV